jgi:hypothetical protein
MRTTLTQEFNTSLNPVTSYDPLQVNAGSMIQQYTDTSGNLYVQPYKPNPYYIYLQAGSTQQNYPYVVSWSDDIDYIFTGQIGTLANINVTLTKFQKSTGVFTTLGNIRFTPSEGAGTNKSFGSVRATLDRWSTGTVSVSGTTVTGSGTGFVSSKISVGARIGFGTTDPTAVVTWYDIASITSDTLLTLNLLPGTLFAGTEYVIEEIRVFTIHRRTAIPFTAAGLHIVKGLHEGVFGSFTVIPQATTVDKQRAFYKLDPGNSVTNQYPLGIALDDKVSDSEQLIYVQNSIGGSTTQMELQVFNIREDLVLTSGIDTGAWEFNTGAVTIVGTFLFSNARVGTLTTGPTAGVKAVYITTTARIYACPMSNIFNGSTSYLTYAHFQTPPGTSNTYIGFAYNQVDISNTLNAIVTCSSAAPFSLQIEPFGGVSTRYFYPWTGRVRNPSTSSDAAEAFTCSGAALNLWVEGGIMYTIAGGAANNYIYAIPLAADYDYAFNTAQYITTSILYTPGCVQFYTVNLFQQSFNGSNDLGGSADACKIYVRTAGILDNSGIWQEVPANGDISSIIGASNEIQVAVAWDIMNASGITPWIYGVNVTYEDGSQDSHYLPSFALSSASARQFAFYQAQLWVSPIPDLRIRLYNATTGFLIIDDGVASSLYGVWEYSSDNGATWFPWSSSADVIGNYIRYTASSLPAATTIRALLTIS